MGESAFDRAFADIEASRDVESLRAAMTRMIETYGLAHAVYHALRLPNDPRENPVVIHSYPVEWIERYRSKRYFEFDPIVLSAARSIIPVDWERIDISAPRAQALFREAHDFGIDQRGLTVPIRGHRGDLAIFTVTSSLQPAEWRRRKLSYMRDMQLLGNYVHQRVLGMSGDEAAPEVALSQREQQCLQWAAAGATITVTADKVGLSERAVRGYLDSARHKLSSLTKAQAVARAINLSIVQPR